MIKNKPFSFLAKPLRAFSKLKRLWTQHEEPDLQHSVATGKPFRLKMGVIKCLFKCCINARLSEVLTGVISEEATDKTRFEEDKIMKSFTGVLVRKAQEC